TQCSQGWAQAGRADEQSRTATEDRVITVIAARYQRLAVGPARDEAETGAVVPATRPLAQVASDCPHRTDLLAGDAFGRLDQRRKRLADLFVIDQLLQRHQGPDRHRIARVANLVQPWYGLNVHHALGRREVLFHQTDQVGSAGEHFSLAPFGA